MLGDFDARREALKGELAAAEVPPLLSRERERGEERAASWPLPGCLQIETGRGKTGGEERAGPGESSGKALGAWSRVDFPLARRRR